MNSTMFNFKDIASITLILFSVIDILGSIPIIINIRKKEGKIESAKATLIAGVLMVVFLYLGQSILKLFGLDIPSFAVAGAIVMFIISLEMILLSGGRVFRLLRKLFTGMHSRVLMWYTAATREA